MIRSVKTRIATMSISALAALLLLGLPGCDRNEGPVEEAAEDVDESLEETAEQIDEAAEEAGDKVEEAADELEEETDEQHY